MNRRGFMKAAAIGAAVVAVPATAVGAVQPGPAATSKNPDAQGFISLKEYGGVAFCYLTVCQWDQKPTPVASQLSVRYRGPHPVYAMIQPALVAVDLGGGVR